MSLSSIDIRFAYLCVLDVLVIVLVMVASLTGASDWSAFMCGPFLIGLHVYLMVAFSRLARQNF